MGSTATDIALAQADDLEYFSFSVGRTNYYFDLLSEQIMRFQRSTTGLFPTDTSDPNCKETHIRDNLYCAIAMWALHLAYKRVSADDGKGYLLGQSAVKTMRGVLKCWMHQTKELNAFTNEQTPVNALHAKFNIDTCFPLDCAQDYPHLQGDLVGLYLLMMVQMIQSGLQIIYTSDEVDFIQNLVFYIERAYRIADYGMWERGSKYNNGTPELHASSVGFCKAALEAVNGFNLFGEHGASWSVIYADVDAHMRNRITLETVLPRESPSKHVDVALLPMIGWPCFAIHDPVLRQRTLDRVIKELKGPYGFKRFSRDSCGCIIEQKGRKSYQPGEIMLFDGVECQWPFFYCYLIVDCIFFGDMAKAKDLYDVLKPLVKETTGGPVIPKYYYVAPEEILSIERESPGSIPRTASPEGENDNYFLWGQAVYIVMQLLLENLLQVNELDPIKRYLKASDRPRWSHRYTAFEAFMPDRVVQVAIIAESARLQQTLATHGVMSQTPKQVEPIQIWSPNELKKAFRYLGANERLGLSGRPDRPVGLLGSSKIFRVCGMTVVCYPLLFEVNDFYTSQDTRAVINQVQYDLARLSKTWKLSGRPTYLMLIREELVQSPNVKEFIDLLASMKAGCTPDGTKVALGRLQSMISPGTVEHLDFLRNVFQEDEDLMTSEFKFQKLEELPTGSYREDIVLNLNIRRLHKKCTEMTDLVNYPDWRLVELYKASLEDVHAQSQALKVLASRHGTLHLIDGCSVHNLLEKIRRKASTSQDWSVVRLCSGLTQKLVDSLAPSITAVMVAGKQLTLGVFGGEETVIDKPLYPTCIHSILYGRCGADVRQAVLQQEMILYLGQLCSTSPKLFSGILKVRVGWLVHAMEYELTLENPGSSIFALAPSEVEALLTKVLSSSTAIGRSFAWKRRLDGALNRVPKQLYKRVWRILERTPGGLRIGDRHLPQQPTLSDLTSHELAFPLKVEELLLGLDEPLRRQIMVEALTVVSTVLDRNPELNFNDTIDLPKLLGQAVEYFRKSHRSGDGTDTSNGSESEVYNDFLKTPPGNTQGTCSYIAKAVMNSLLENEMLVESNSECLLM